MKPTILFGGLTEAHERLIKATLEGFGYQAQYLPTPDNEALRIGKEYCNKGECNPVYYTVGNLLKFLFQLKEKGIKDVAHKYVFVTIGSCGPCRFGMYETEYRKALREAGFPDFKVIALDQGKAITQELNDVGLNLSRSLIEALLKAVILGDLINDVYYQVKPYELSQGATDNWKEESLNLLEEALREKRNLLKPLRNIKNLLSTVKVNYLIPKPKVRIIGEFFAQTTEGEGNYKLAKWLIEEGAQPLVEPVTGWIDYLIYQKWLDTKIEPSLSKKEKLLMFLKLRLLAFYIRFTYNLYRKLLGNKPSELKKTEKLASLAARYYHPRLVGGEGYLEIAKHIYSFKYRSADLVVSVKPFGCMPSTQSDGVQSKVAEDLGSLFVSVETSGDAEANVKSRILMKLYEAKIKALEEFEETKLKLNLTNEKIKHLIEKKREIKRADTILPAVSSVEAVNALYYLIR